ncbi:MAG: NAD-dependent epimerase [Candidatus Accumulibacter delftensis]|jgi:UDP-glucuronate 4-epimerase
MKILLTGAAGFIGMSTALCLLARGDEVVGLDNLNDYYEVSLKEDRLRQLTSLPGFRFAKLDVADRPGIEQLFAAERFERVIHLAAQAGVRYSLQNPQAYVDSNLVGFVNILEGCRHNQVQHLVYASSSSVYGGNTRMPFSEHDSVDHPVSLYAATKKANELMAHTYSHLYGLPTTGLRFFTVYGPWGRPDMALFLFTRAILEGRPIDVFNHGRMQRDFTYVDDIVEGVIRVMDRWPRPMPATFRTQRIRRRATSLTGCSTSAQPVPLLDFIAAIEEAIGRKAEKRLLPMQDGDVPATWADTALLEDWVGFAPATPVAEGVKRATCLTGCSTSVITSRCRCLISLPPSKRRSAGRRKSACCRCRTATCRRPGPIRHCWRTGSVLRRRRRWRKG